jgi:hypothetical protein
VEQAREQRCGNKEKWKVNKQINLEEKYTKRMKRKHSPGSSEEEHNEKYPKLPKLKGISKVRFFKLMLF